MNEVKEKFEKLVKEQGDCGCARCFAHNVESFINSCAGMKLVPEDENEFGPVDFNKEQPDLICLDKSFQTYGTKLEELEKDSDGALCRIEQLEKRVAALEDGELKIDQIDNCLVDVIGRVAAVEEDKPGITSERSNDRLTRLVKCLVDGSYEDLRKLMVMLEKRIDKLNERLSNPCGFKEYDPKFK